MSQKYAKKLGGGKGHSSGSLNDMKYLFNAYWPPMHSDVMAGENAFKLSLSEKANAVIFPFLVATCSSLATIKTDSQIQLQVLRNIS